MDRRVRVAVELLRKQESLPPPGNSQTTNNGYEQDVRESLTIDELARRVKLSPAYFRTLFRRDMKTTPSRYVKQLKIENAIKLAEETNLAITRIVEIVGGVDASHFQREVKKATGKTLGEFRKLRLQQAEEESSDDGIEP
ncbi:MAG: helix-turn-helix domain-containing protein [Blastocatellia bacterium]